MSGKLTDEQVVKCAKLFAAMWQEVCDGEASEQTDAYLEHSGLCSLEPATEDDIIDTDHDVGDPIWQLNADGIAVIAFVEDVTLAENTTEGE